MLTDDEARARLLRILDDAKTFEELEAGITDGQGAKASAIFDRALKFIADGDAGGLDGELRERFAQVLSRFVESRKALHLAGVLENEIGR
jgi:hypothetical protein